jgi:hypothetical protein
MEVPANIEMNYLAASCEVSLWRNLASYRSKLRGIRPEKIKKLGIQPRDYLERDPVRSSN